MDERMNETRRLSGRLEGVSWMGRASQGWVIIYFFKE